MTKILVYGPKDPKLKTSLPESLLIVNTTSTSKTRSKFLSPFFLGPVQVPGNRDYTSKTMENAWQYSKVYDKHWDGAKPTEAWWRWACKGWAKDTADRYPMGRGAMPVGSHYDGDLLGYIEARQRIYVPCYANVVVQHPLWEEFKEYALSFETVVLWDFDGYNTADDYSTILNNPHRKMGHAFVIRELLHG